MSPHDDAHGLVADAPPAQIASIEPLLMRLAHAPQDRVLLDALFRCARGVRDAARSFGLDEVEAFTRPLASLTDRLRQGDVMLTPALSALLLECNEQIRRLIDEATGGIDEPGGPALRAALVARLEAFCGEASLHNG